MAEASFLKPSDTESLNYTQGKRLLQFMRLDIRSMCAYTIEIYGEESVFTISS